MNKLTFFLSTAAVLGLVACKNEAKDVDDTSTPSGSTYAGLYIRTQNSGTRNVTDSEEDHEGRTEEKALEKIQLLSSVKSMSWNKGTQLSPGHFAAVTGDPTSYTVEPWMTQPGTHFMALLVNKSSEDLVPGMDIANAKNTVYGSGQNPADNIAALSTENHFVMTSKSIRKEIKEGVSKTAVQSGSDETSNVFKIDIERVVAQGLVAKATGLNAETVDGRGSIALNDIKYAAINGAVKTYLFADNAGERTMGTDQEYNDLKSAIHSFTEYKNAQNHETVKDKLIRLSNFSNNVGNYAPIQVSENTALAKNSRGVYFFENSVDKTSSWTKDNKDYGFYRMAYAKIYAQFTPKVVYYNEGGTLKAKPGVPGATFYQGETDGLFYDTKDAAKKSDIAPDQKAYTYTNGKCAYRVLWNRQLNTQTPGVVSVKNADTRRNNVYLIEIKGFQTIGMPWDSSDPNDPNLPKPSDSEEPTSPDNPDIEKQDTYMRVEAKILKWNLVSRQVILD